MTKKNADYVEYCGVVPRIGIRQLANCIKDFCFFGTVLQ